MRAEKLLYGILAVALIVLLYNLGSWSLVNGEEARYAEISREMLRAGDYLHPRLFAVDTYDRPPLTYWLTALGLRLWGVNAFGARFFVQLALIAQTVLVYYIGLRLLGSEQVALFSGLIYLSLPLVLVSSRQLAPEIFAATFELGAIYGLLRYYLTRRVWVLYAIALMLALGLLTTGLSSLLLPGAFCLYLLWSHRRHPLAAPFHWRQAAAAGLLAAGLGGIWFLYLLSQQPAFGGFFGQTYLSVAWGSGWQLPLWLVAGSLPWCGFLAVGWPRPSFWHQAVIRPVMLFWLLLPLLWLLLSAQTALSLLAIAAGLAVVLGYWLQTIASPKIRHCSRLALGLYLALGLLALGGPLVAQLWRGQLSSSGPMLLTALVLIAIALLLFKLIRVGTRFRLVAVALAASLLLLLYSGYFIAANPHWRPTTDALAQFIRARELQDLPILVYDEALPALAFALDRDLVTLNAGQVLPDVRFQTRPAWRDRWILLDRAAAMPRLQQLTSGPSVLIVRGALPEQLYWPELSYLQAEQVGPWQVLYQT
ncbi:MAG: phospholipid carrier-dependent glycosyltransferase [Leptolyngbya sp. SIO4C1]|nr:phospholipid carrier-dependent glycosyltransferase [Leptolyngbya sp. SIO4C1]